MTKRTFKFIREYLLLRKRVAKLEMQVDMLIKIGVIKR